MAPSWKTILAEYTSSVHDRSGWTGPQPDEEELHASLLDRYGKIGAEDLCALDRLVRAIGSASPPSVVTRPPLAEVARPDRAPDAAIINNLGGRDHPKLVATLIARDISGGSYITSVFCHGRAGNAVRAKGVTRRLKAEAANKEEPQALPEGPYGTQMWLEGGPRERLAGWALATPAEVYPEALGPVLKGTVDDPEHADHWAGPVPNHGLQVEPGGLILSQLEHIGWAEAARRVNAPGGFAQPCTQLPLLVDSVPWGFSDEDPYVPLGHWHPGLDPEFIAHISGLRRPWAAMAFTFAERESAHLDRITHAEHGSGHDLVSKVCRELIAGRVDPVPGVEVENKAAAWCLVGPFTVDDSPVAADMLVTLGTKEQPLAAWLIATSLSADERTLLANCAARHLWRGRVGDALAQALSDKHELHKVRAKEEPVRAFVRAMVCAGEAWCALGAAS
ncbi:MAG: hypothetical protein JHD16_00870 [Solirubrobacteraceae bacterium]|nr:hypothetical protein [Solirubrobacteraceae bacterium]